MSAEIQITDNSAFVLSELEKQKHAILEAIGLSAEAHAKESAPVGTPESTGIQNYHGGTLRKSLSHKVVNDEVYVGTNASVMQNGKRVSYPIFVEFGTGVYASDGNGRKSPWTWYDKNGKAHWTQGIKPTHFLRNAVSSREHIAEYKKIIERMLKNS